MQNVAAISELLKPYDARLMRCYPVSSRVNRVENDDEECAAPVEPVQNQGRLFRNQDRASPPATTHLLAWQRDELSC
jgi:hypothetical protein